MITGEKSVWIGAPGEATVLDVLTAFIGRFPETRPVIFDEQGSLRADFPLFVDGRNPRLLPGSIHRPIQPGQVLSLFSPVSSGRMSVESLRGAAAGKRDGANES